jgi:hypothetical protein
MRNLIHLTRNPDCPELVEGLFFFKRLRATHEEKDNPSTSSG